MSKKNKTGPFSLGDKFKLPPHVSCYIEHNDHLTVYRTAAEAIEESEVVRDGFETDEDRQRSIDTDQIWTMQVFRNTPVGFEFYSASSLGKLIDWAWRSEMGVEE